MAATATAPKINKSQKIREMLEKHGDRPYSEVEGELTPLGINSGAYNVEKSKWKKAKGTSTPKKRGPKPGSKHAPRAMAPVNGHSEAVELTDAEVLDFIRGEGFDLTAAEKDAHEAMESAKRKVALVEQVKALRGRLS